MTKLSQCARCDYDRRCCGNYTPENDTDCPYYMRGGVVMKCNPLKKVNDNDNAEVGCSSHIITFVLHLLGSLLWCKLSIMNVGLIIGIVLIALILLGMIWLVYDGLRKL